VLFGSQGWELYYMHSAELPTADTDIVFLSNSGYTMAHIQPGQTLSWRSYAWTKIKTTDRPKNKMWLHVCQWHPKSVCLPDNVLLL